MLNIYNIHSFIKNSIVYILITLFFYSCAEKSTKQDLTQHFKGKYGQIEIGGKYVGLEFHQSRPLPSRISFYYPIANSIVSSADYWQRYKSIPFTVLLKSEGKTDTIGNTPYPYHYSPYKAKFENIEGNYIITFSYGVCEDIPILVLRLKVKNLSAEKSQIEIETSLRTVLRTSHTFAHKNRALVEYKNNNALATAAFNDVDTDSAMVFIANAGEVADIEKYNPAQLPTESNLQFTYKKNLEAGEEIEIIQLIGMCRQNESAQIIDKSLQQWQKSLSKNSDRILNWVFNQSYFNVEDSVFMQTAYWSKAVLASNIHYIDGQFVPMPCPAEYNFFFTHDLLLTSLGAMYFDLDYVKRGFHFLHGLTKEDSVLAHAYYWKDTQFVTEYSTPDNWNNMWIIIAASSYLKHSADFETMELLFPILKKSLFMMLKSKGEDDLMYSKRPDWWDIGNVYGAKSYNTTLMYKALQDYVYLASQLDKKDEPLVEYMQLAERMKKQFVEKFWNEKSEFLINMIDQKTIDHHYYSGSLLSTYYGLLDDDKKSKLLKTAKDTLLDEKIGIRNAMPPDFHELISIYKFNGMEAGEPYIYFNGAVWPQGNVWYALGLLSNDQVDEAKNVVKKYLTLEGIQNSPNGQPSFYEYRISDPKSTRYGEIDKPTFLWAGGLYLHTLYQLAGLRENSWNIYFNSNLPTEFKSAEYDLTLFGRLARIKWRGQGKYFRQIEIDGQIQYSAIITSPANRINFKRGKPETPYLAEANCQINNVFFLTSEKKFTIEFSGIADQDANLRVISLFLPEKIELNGSDFVDILDEMKSDGIYTYVLRIKATKKNNELVFHFTQK
jgi:hypothetical protein